MFKKLAVGNDHGGYSTKLLIVQHLQDQGYDVIDFGSNDENIVRYPYYAALVSNAVVQNEVDGGILICSTGIGMSIAANKIKGARASLCTSAYMAKMTRLHNNSNILCLGGKITGAFEIIDILEAWLSNDFMGERHLISLEMIREGENHIMNNEIWVPSEDIACCD